MQYAINTEVYLQNSSESFIINLLKVMVITAIKNTSSYQIVHQKVFHTQTQS